jgi:hypothetical protein
MIFEFEYLNEFEFTFENNLLYKSEDQVGAFDEKISLSVPLRVLFIHQTVRGTQKRQQVGVLPF